jgi:methylenetetrahydrofolate dehydrogenase (NADP+)/methenyltetrahydrofolate cyclohydrolase
MRLLHGRPLAEKVNARSRERVAALTARGVTPRLAVVSIGIDPAASTYQERLVRSGKQLGIDVQVGALPRGTSENAAVERIVALGADRAVHGILLLTPLPLPLSEARLVDEVPPGKDVEGVHPYNVGLMRAGRPRFIPSTADAIVELLKFHDVPLRGATAVVIGRSPVVGRPTATLLTNEDATVTVAHSQTPDIPALTRAAAIVVVAVGKAGFLTGDMLAPGATVIDAGINVTPAGLVGDADFESVSSVAGALSPVPGGLGAVTTALLLRNVVTAAESQSS